MIYTLAAYIMWGFFPAFFPLLLPATPLKILAHRVLWTAVIVTAFLVFSGGWRELVRMDKRTWGWLAAGGVFITVNWGTYVLAINTDHVADAALGYFINPLVSVALGMIFLKEQLRPWQATTVAVAAIAVLYLTFFTGQAPYISLLLAASFGIYGLIKKQVRVSAAVSVAAEALVVSPRCHRLYRVDRAGGPRHVHFGRHATHAALNQRRPDHRAATIVLCPRRADAALVDDRHAPIPHPHHADAVGALCHPRALLHAPVDWFRHHRRSGQHLHCGSHSRSPKRAAQECAARENAKWLRAQENGA